MRLQSPQLHQPFSGSIASTNIIQNSLCLPDSLGVFVGERFTAYLGILNASKSMSIRKLAVSALLQTPTQRWNLPSPLDPASSVNGGTDIAPNSGIDAIVSHDIEEHGQHILRVEVSYINEEGNTKTFRKFYRFQVVSPLIVTSKVLRAGDTACFVSVIVSWNSADQPQNDDNNAQLLISEVDFAPSPGLTATSLNTKVDFEAKDKPSAIDLFDKLTLLTYDGCCRYLFKVEATSKEAIFQGVVHGDNLGRAIVTWRKAMGETGRIASSPVLCPAAQPEIPTLGSNAEKNFVVFNSGLPVDVAASAASSSKGISDGTASDLAKRLPVTVQPIDSPALMQLHSAHEVEFLVVNHGTLPMNLQLRFRMPPTSGLSVCGISCQTLGEVPPNGGSTVAAVRFMPLAAGLLTVKGCSIIDVASEKEIAQPALFQTFVEQSNQ
jgi:hypothetical protein